MKTRTKAKLIKEMKPRLDFIQVKKFFFFFIIQDSSTINKGKSKECVQNSHFLCSHITHSSWLLTKAKEQEIRRWPAPRFQGQERHWAPGAHPAQEA